MTLKKQAMILGAVALVGLFGCEKKAKLNTDQEKASYAIGQQIGKSLKMQNADVVVPSLVAGMNDAIEGKEGKLKPEEMQKALQAMQESAMKKAMEQAQVNEKKGEEYLAANKQKEGWKETASGLQYKVIT
jgi:FKBP-type peptidyl-prolyl cis-trans isomerase